MSIVHLLTLALALGILPAAPAQEHPPARVYTNDDLDRVAPLRAETGGSSRPATARGAAATASVPADRRRPGARSGEDYWRAQAEAVRNRVRPLREKLLDLQARVDERRRKPGVRPYSDPQVLALQAQAARVEAQIRDLEDGLADRARRAGALPGWLR